LCSKRIKASELKPGLVLYNDICSQSGLLLLKKGTVFHQAIINNLQNKYPHIDLYIEEELTDSEINTGNPNDSNDSNESEVVEVFSDGRKAQEEILIKINDTSPTVADEETKKIYVQAYKTINEIYKHRKIKPYLNDLYEIIGSLINKLSVNPEMLMQLALLKKIDNFCLSHSVNVSIFAAYLGRLAGMDPVTLKHLSFAGMMHDIGKLDIPQEILTKKEELSEQEFESVKLHSLHSFFRLSSVEKMEKNILEGVLQHHERVDGSGYPHGLKGNEIHLWGRILGIVDAYDTFTSNDNSRDSVSRHQGLEILITHSDQFDQNLLNRFIKNTSFYPIGCRVLLNSGEIGIVVGIHRHIPFRPIVRVINKDHGKEKNIDLSQQLSLHIEEILYQ